MKKLFLLSMACIGLCMACNNGKDDGENGRGQTSGGSITIPTEQLSQNIYADVNEAEISFTATKPWSTSVEFDSTKADTADAWLTLDHTSGSAGDITIKITLSTNTSGKDRKAVISILCDGKTVTIAIEQKATTESGDIPEDDPDPIQPKKLVSVIHITKTDLKTNEITEGGSDADLR